MQSSDGNNNRGYNPFAQSQLQPQPANNNADCLRDMQQDNDC